MSIKLKITAIVIASLLILSALAGGITAIVLNDISKSKALTNDSSYSIGNLLNGSEINIETAEKLVRLLGGFSGERNAAEIKELNNDSEGNPIPVVFQMGEVYNSTTGQNVPIYWEVVYQTNGYITVWMTQPYTADVFNGSDATYCLSTKNLNLIRKYINANYATNNQYLIHPNYSESDIRNLTKAIYYELMANNSIINDLIKSPKEANIEWQYDCEVQPDVLFSDTVKTHHNGLFSSDGTASFDSWNWDNSVYDDKFWIPSYYEVYNTSISESTFNGGKWVLSIDDVKHNVPEQANQYTALDGTRGGALKYPWMTWTRTGSTEWNAVSFRSNTTKIAFSSHYSVNNSLGIRPACHISLSFLATYVLSDKELSIGNILNEDGTSINTETVTKLNEILGDNPANNERTAADIKALNNGLPLIFEMGSVFNETTQQNVPIYWQVVYQTGDAITIWMTEPYTADRFNGNSETRQLQTKNLNLIREHIDNNYAAYSEWSYLGNYSQSDLRTLTRAIYADMIDTDAFPIINNFIVSPQEANISWQYDCTDQIDSGYSHHNGMYNSNGTNSYTSWSWDSAVYNDKFWIPSYYEVFYDENEENWTFDGGKWALSKSEIEYASGDDSQSTLALDGTVYSPSNNGDAVFTYLCWLRSGLSTSNSGIMQIYSSGSASGGAIHLSSGVRPAAHISLSLLIDTTIPRYDIQINANNEIFGSVQGAGEYKENSTVTLTATANPGYTFVGWSLDGGETLIPESIGKNEYTITVTQDATYTAVFESEITITSANPDTEFSITREVNNGIRHRYTIQANSGYYIDRIALINNSATASEEDYQDINSTDGYLNTDSHCIALHYITNTTGTELILEVYYPITPFTIYLNFTTEPQNYKSSGSVDGVAVSVAYQNADGSINTGGTNTDGTPLNSIGEARIKGYTTINGVEYIYLEAFAYTNYTFVGWMMDGEFITDTESGVTYTGNTYRTANIPLSLIDGKQVFAVFE